MVRLLLSVTRRLPIVLAGLAVAFAVQRWFWFHTLPRHASARYCGNCFLSAVGIPTEMGLIGLLVVGFSLLRVPYSSANSVFYWACAAVGVLLTPAVIGLPLFAFAFVVLMLPVIKAMFNGAITTIRS